MRLAVIPARGGSKRVQQQQAHLQRWRERRLGGVLHAGGAHCQRVRLAEEEACARALARVSACAQPHGGRACALCQPASRGLNATASSASLAWKHSSTTQKQRNGDASIGRAAPLPRSDRSSTPGRRNCDCRTPVPGSRNAAVTLPPPAAHTVPRRAMEFSYSKLCVRGQARRAARGVDAPPRIPCSANNPLRKASQALKGSEETRQARVARSSTHARAGAAALTRPRCGRRSSARPGFAVPCRAGLTRVSSWRAGGRCRRCAPVAASASDA